MEGKRIRKWGGRGNDGDGQGRTLVKDITFIKHSQRALESPDAMQLKRAGITDVGRLGGEGMEKKWRGEGKREEQQDGGRKKQNKQRNEWKGARGKERTRARKQNTARQQTTVSETSEWERGSVGQRKTG